MPEPATNYQALAQEYARHRRIHPGVFERIVTRATTSGLKAILEVGCGSGNYLEAIAAIGAFSVAGIDPSSAMLDRLRERMPAAEVVIASAESIPFPDRSFDLIYSVDVIHHVKDRDAFVREARRVLNPGGWLVTVTDSEEDLERRVPLTSHFPETLEHERRRYPSTGTLRTELLGAGFMNVTEEQVQLSYPLSDLSGFREKAYSSLHLIDDAAHARGMARLEAELERGPIEALSLYTLLWGRAPGGEPGS